jgi:hypothetical protein
VFVEAQTDLVVSGDGFELRLAADCASECRITTDATGRQVLTLEQNGLARVNGDGFAPATPVYVWLFSEPRYLGELTVNADGTFDGSVPIGDIDVGTHTLQVNGTSFDGRDRTANLGVTVDPDPEAIPLPTTDVLPATGSDHGLVMWFVFILALGVALVVMTRRPGARPVD